MNKIFGRFVDGVSAALETAELSKNKARVSETENILKHLSDRHRLDPRLGLGTD